MKSGVNYEAAVTSDGTLIRPRGGGGGGVGGPPSSIGVYRIKSFQGNYLTCRSWNGSTDGAEDVYVAKPSKLRNSITSAVIDGVAVSYTYDASTLQRSASASGYTAVIHTIVPPYNVNDVIEVVDCYTGVVTVAPATIQAVTKLDLNGDARAWAARWS